MTILENHMDITKVSFHKYVVFSMSKAAQGFSLRRTSSTPQAETRRRTLLIGKRTIYEWKLFGCIQHLYE